MADLQRVLFLCTGNSCRSQMAEGLARTLRGTQIEPYSAGTAPVTVNPLSVEVMAEAGVDIRGQRSKHVRELVDRGLTFDWVVTLCAGAKDACPVFPGKPTRVHAGFEDPAAVEGTREERLEAFRRVRDAIRAFVLKLPESLETGSKKASAEGS